MENSNGNGGTPNPLRSSIDGLRPAARPTTQGVPMASPAAPAPATAPITLGAPTVAPTTPVAPATPVTPAANLAVPNTAANTNSAMPMQNANPAQTLDPTGRTMEQAKAQGPEKKKKKKGVIVGIVLAAVLLLGGGIAAAVVLLNMNSDPVALAMQKIMSGEAPSNVAIDGDIDLHINSADSPISRINIDLDSDITVGSMINTSTAVLNITDNKGKDHSVKFSELYSANGDLFFKLEGIAELLENVDGLVDTTTTGQNIDLGGEVEESVESMKLDANELDDDTEFEPEDEDGEEIVVETEDGGSGGMEVMDTEHTETIVTSPNTTTGDDYTSLMQYGLIDILKTNDGVWIRIPVDELSGFDGAISEQSDTNCIVNLVSDINKNSASTANLYNKYPFIKSSKDDVIIPSKQDPVYKLSVDSENFTNFVNSIDNPTMTKDLYSCLNIDNNATLTAEDMAEIVNKLPTVYAEVNGNHDFTRLYLETDAMDGGATMTIDLGFKYPTNVNVSEPVEYVDFSQMIEEFTTKLRGTPTVEDATTE